MRCRPSIAGPARWRGALLGFAVWSLVLDKTELLDIGVAPTARRQGLGARLLAEVIATARAAGATRPDAGGARRQPGRASLVSACWLYGDRPAQGYYPAPDGRGCLSDG